MQDTCFKSQGMYQPNHIITGLYAVAIAPVGSHSPNRYLIHRDSRVPVPFKRYRLAHWLDRVVQSR